MEEEKTQHQKVFELKKWNAVALWSWNTEVENCAICKGNIHEKCVNCTTSPTDPECNLEWGSCNHGFHHHCLSKWLQTRNICPLCQKSWETARIGLVQN